MTDRELMQIAWVKDQLAGYGVHVEVYRPGVKWLAPQPDREWVGLTDQEYVYEQQQAWNEVNVIDGFNTGEYSQVLWKRIEAKLKEKNCG